MSSTLTSERRTEVGSASADLTAEAATRCLQQSPDDYATPEALMALVARVSVAHADGVSTDRAVLYSGEIDAGPPKLGAWALATGMQAQDTGVLIIDVTERGRFLTSEAFQEAMIRAFADEGFESYADIAKARGSAANNFLFDADGGVWAQASRSFAQALEGDVITLTSQADPGRTFGLIELPALLGNPKVNSVNGIPKTTLAQLAAQPNGQAFVFKALAETSKAMLNQCAVAWDGNQRMAHVDTTPLIGRSSPPPSPDQIQGEPKLIRAGQPHQATLNGLKKATWLIQRRWLERVLGIKPRRRGPGSA
jgi:hypothetical protein